MTGQDEQLRQLADEWTKRAEFYRGVQGRREPGNPEWREAKCRASELETCVRSLSALLPDQPEPVADQPVEERGDVCKNCGAWRCICKSLRPVPSQPLAEQPQRGEA